MGKYRITNMKTGYLKKPLGIETEAINFSWQLQSVVPGTYQKCYRIKVLNEDKKILHETAEVCTDISFGKPSSFQFEEGKGYFWQVSVQLLTEEWVVSELAYFETGIRHDSFWRALPFIETRQVVTVAPVFKWAQETLPGNIKKARLYFTTLGVYQAAVNGEILGEGKDYQQYLNPGYGNKQVDHSYQVFDLTENLQKNQQFSFSCEVGKGWYHGMLPGTYQPAIKGLLAITDKSDRVHYFWTDEKSTTASSDYGQVRANSLYYGEDIDSRFTSFCELSQETKPLIDTLELQQKNYIGDLISRPGLTGYVLKKKQLAPKKMRILPENQDFNQEIKLLQRGQTLIVDFGQNTTAIPKLTFFSPDENMIRLRFAEMLNDGGSWDAEPHNHNGDGPAGTLYRKNYRNARSEITYQTSGNQLEEYTSQLSFFGYRYMEISVENDFYLYEVGSIPLSSMTERTGFITTNNPKVNQLVENTFWSQSSNYFTTATDCPQRDERLFWSGDAQVFIQTGLYNCDAVAFMGDLQAIMASNTQLLGFCPMVVDETNGEYFSAFCAGWSDALIINAWVLFQTTGETSFLATSWPAMMTYYQFLITHERSQDQAPLFGDKNCGDWLSFQGTNVAMMGDYYYIYVLELMIKIAVVLEEDTSELEQKISKVKKRFYEEHVQGMEYAIHLKSGNLSSAPYQFFGHGENSKSGVWEDDSQTALLWYLKLKLPRSEKEFEQVRRMLINNIENQQPNLDSIRSSYGEKTLAVGFLGINVLLEVLTEIGHSDLAYDLLLQDEALSWLFEVKTGATTIWERWDSYSKARGFGHSEMNSYNHYSYGAVCQWLYERALGIKMSQDIPGFKVFDLEPLFDFGVQYNGEERIQAMEGYVFSPYGKIEVKWQRELSNFSYEVTIPSNSTGRLILPENFCVSEELQKINVKHVGKQVFQLTAGKWQLTGKIN